MSRSKRIIKEKEKFTGQNGNKFLALHKMHEEIKAKQEERAMFLQSEECPFKPELHPTPEEFNKGMTAMPFEERVDKSIRDRIERQLRPKYT